MKTFTAAFLAIACFFASNSLLAQSQNCFADWYFQGGIFFYCETQCIVYEDPDTGNTVIEDCCGGGMVLSYELEFEYICP